MSESWFTELVRQVPNLVIFLLIVYLFQKNEEKREAQRVENARRLEDKREAHERELEKKRQAHDLQMNNMWASYIKSIIDQQTDAYKALIEIIKEHEEASQERYKRMGITNELIKQASKTLGEKE